MRTQKNGTELIFIPTRPVRTLKDAFWMQKDAFWTPKKGLRALSKEDLTGHKQKNEHFVTYVKKIKKEEFSFKHLFFLERRI